MVNHDLLLQQAAWLAPVRARLLRWAQIAQRQTVLDLGAGSGAVTAELERRAGGLVVSLDKAHSALRYGSGPRVAGVAEQLPFAEHSFDLIFTQFVLMYTHLPTAVAEISRVLQPGGKLVAIEPDYGGLIEYPDTINTAVLWQSALARVGATAHTGRQLPYWLAEHGLRVEVNLLDTLATPAPERFAFLRSLPLTSAEAAQLDEIEQEAQALQSRPWGQLAHLPLFLIHATRL
jgi:SAM-dependent methyltransferase